MIWVSVNDPVKPVTLNVNYQRETSYHLLLWLKDDTFTTGWMVKDLTTRVPEITWVSNVDITREVTHWCAKVVGPKA